MEKDLLVATASTSSVPGKTPAAKAGRHGSVTRLEDHVQPRYFERRLPQTDASSSNVSRKKTSISICAVATGPMKPR